MTWADQLIVKPKSSAQLTEERRLRKNERDRARYAEQRGKTPEQIRPWSARAPVSASQSAPGRSCNTSEGASAKGDAE